MLIYHLTLIKLEGRSQQKGWWLLLLLRGTSKQQQQKLYTLYAPASCQQSESQLTTDRNTREVCLYIREGRQRKNLRRKGRYKSRGHSWCWFISAAETGGWQVTPFSLPAQPKTIRLFVFVFLEESCVVPFSYFSFYSGHYFYWKTRDRYLSIKLSIHLRLGLPVAIIATAVAAVDRPIEALSWEDSKRTAAAAGQVVWAVLMS